MKFSATMFLLALTTSCFSLGEIVILEKLGHPTQLWLACSAALAAAFSAIILWSLSK